MEATMIDTTNHHQSDEEEEITTVIAKSPCQLCMKQEHKYKCPRCLYLTCSLQCSKEHKQQTGCSGQKDHVASLSVRMNDFALSTMKRDLRFLDQAISVSNKTKKVALLDPTQGGVAQTKIPKKVKNLRYFLRKKRNIIYKNSPTSMFSRSSLNNTYFDSSTPDKLVYWTVELIFLKKSAIPTLPLTTSPLHDCIRQAQIVLSTKNLLVPEDTPVGSLVKKNSLRKNFFSEQFSLLLTNHCDEDFETSKVYIKRLEALPTTLGGALPFYSPSLEDQEEGEISSMAAASSEGEPQARVRAVFKEIERASTLREVLEGTVVFEYPTLYVVLPGTVKEE
ncbi:hypothetical protein FGO68_gene247 [Halteria grandinella]|uniref:HIT-type domain-containing protein n=1 Tax=Halteria grandinella TaxID=5974 RepID=A0A8J8NGN8_HALGN|nr:hypothetical protein FGO68_gene247 [Halteria grandinella]